VRRLAPQPIAIAVILLLGGACARLVAACSSDDPTPAPETDGDGGGGDGAAPEAAVDAGADVAPSCSLPGVYGSKACMRCVAAACCAQVTACESDPTCKAMQRCTLDCLPKNDGGGCYQTCQSTHAGGLPLWQPVYDCWYGPPPEGCLVDCT